jgi:type I restriction enzyme, S subunit
MTWGRAKLSEVADIERAGISSDAIATGTRYLGLEHIESGGKILGAATVEAGDLASTKFRFTSRHVLYGKLRPYLAKIATPDFDGICSTDIVPIMPGPGLDRSFLTHFLRQPAMIEFANSRTTGANLPRLSPKALADFEIPLPPLQEQKRIVAILDQADELRRKRQRAIDRVNQLGQAIFIEMFGDPRFSPKLWDVVRLGDLCEVGSSKRVFVEEFVESGVPFYRGTEVGKLGAGEEIEPDLFIAPSHYEVLVTHSGKPEIGDLLLPSICHDGRIWKVDSSEPFYFKDGRVLWIKSSAAAIDSEYLKTYLQNRFLYDYASIASGTTFAELKIVNLKNLTILNPPMELQTKFSERVSVIEKMHPVQHRSKESFDALFNALQHQAFRGEL